jgi:hypothetical protein
MPRNNRATLLASAATVAPVIDCEAPTQAIETDLSTVGIDEDDWSEPAEEPKGPRISARPGAPRAPPAWLDDNERVLTVDETAGLLGVSTFTLLRMRQRPNADGLPFVQLSPKRIGYRLCDIRSYLQACRVGSLLEVS